MYSFDELQRIRPGLVVYILLCKIANDSLLGVLDIFTLIPISAILFFFVYLIVLYIFDKKNLFSIMAMIKK